MSNEHKIVDGKSVEVKAAEHKITEQQKLSERKLAEDKVAEGKLAEIAEGKLAEYKLAESKLAEHKIAEGKRAEHKIAEGKRAEVRLAESNLAVRADYKLVDRDLVVHDLAGRDLVVRAESKLSEYKLAEKALASYKLAGVDLANGVVVRTKTLHDSIPGLSFQKAASDAINSIILNDLPAIWAHVKGKAVLVIAMLLFAGSALATGVVTQTVAGISDNLPITGDVFQKKINTAVVSLITDVSNLVVAVDGGVTTNATVTLTSLQTKPYTTNTWTSASGAITNTVVWYASGLKVSQTP